MAVTNRLFHFANRLMFPAIRSGRAIGSSAQLGSVFQKATSQIPHRSVYSFAKYPTKSVQNPFWWVVGVGLGLLTYMMLQQRDVSAEELQSHSTLETGLWVAWQDPQDQRWYVSEMASFIEEHPGGDKIKQAGGQSAMRFWQIFTRHLDANGNPTPQVLVELRKRIVGKMTQPPANAQILDPYELEPDRSHYRLIPLQPRPFCAGKNPEELTTFITDVSDIFVRFHTPAPLVQNHSLVIQAPGVDTTMTLDTLAQFDPITYISSMQCTGHDRANMLPKTNGLQWEAAIANVKVTGYPLWDILKKLGIRPEEGKYLLAEQLDEKGGQLFSTCIPLSQLPEDTLLATHLNGESLTRDHGAPIRLWVPGFNGNFSVKKTDRIRIVTAESAPPEKVAKYSALKEWAIPVALSDNLVAYVQDINGHFSFEPELRVNSMIQAPREGIKVSKGTEQVPLKGWAWSGGGRSIDSVEFSADKGKTWEKAALNPVIEQPVNKRYAWTGWEATVPITSSKTQVLVRAKDSAGRIQPEHFTWNPRGLRKNNYSGVVIEVV